MRRACQLVALFAILAVIAPPSPSPVAACSPTVVAPPGAPTYPPTVLTTYQRVTTSLQASVAVFRGTVIAVDGSQGAYRIPSSTTFRVNTVWKGAVGPIVTVRNADAESYIVCASSFVEGFGQYRAYTGDDTIVFVGQDKDGKWYFNSTTHFASDEYAQILGVGMPAATAMTGSQTVPPSESGVLNRGVLWTTVGLILMLSLIGSVFVIQRRKP